MPDTNLDYRELLNEKFAHVNEKLELIHEQTLKTNGRVNALEVRVNFLEKEEAVHVLKCPNVAKIEQVNEELMEYRMMKKYPKAFIVMLWISGASIVAITLHSIGIF